ncbi:ribosomal protein L21-like protein [Daldinia caldariorum]|uniref:ribosomal protein L21-like protein n=1 Tax=Daldinia caldariorum TaxID=326644 RepID=UPI0020088485|nr:ribosomal protein L21-like protein [Daldinia caldariorum]KAI1467475.1 ribosomal protein L21-like protein [Daldinia caldariorum]
MEAHSPAEFVFTNKYLPKKMSRSLLRSVLELRTPITRLPPPLLLPIRARSLATTAARHNSEPTTSPSATHTQTTVPPIAPSKPPSSSSSSSPTPTPSAGTTPTTSTSVAQFLPLLRAQPAHYITVLIHGRPYLVTQGDRIRLPFLMHGVLPGDVLRLDRASTLGSRDYTLVGTPHVDPALFECRATVLGVESEPLRVKVKTKRRNRRSRRVASKHRYTVLAISELKVLGPS